MRRRHRAVRTNARGRERTVLRARYASTAAWMFGSPCMKSFTKRGRLPGNAEHVVQHDAYPAVGRRAVPIVGTRSDLRDLGPDQVSARLRAGRPAPRPSTARASRSSCAGFGLALHLEAAERMHRLRREARAHTHTGTARSTRKRTVSAKPFAAFERNHLRTGAHQLDAACECLGRRAVRAPNGRSAISTRAAHCGHRRCDTRCRRATRAAWSCGPCSTLPSESPISSTSTPNGRAVRQSSRRSR